MTVVKPRILLIVPKSRYIFKDFPLGINYVAASIKKTHPDISCEVVDLNKDEDLERVLANLRPHIIGVTVTMPLTNEAFMIARICRSALPNSLLVAGGPQPTIQPEIFLEEFDLVVRGEGETIFPKIIKSWSEQKYHCIASVCGNIGGKKWLSQHIANSAGLDQLPYPYRSEIDRYRDYIFENETVAPIITSRGCSYSCIFCAKEVFDNRIRFRSIADVIKELLEVINSTGITCFQFRDDVFTLNKTRTKELASKIININPAIKWLCNTRADLLDPLLVKHMAACGCKRISMGVESADSAALALLQKQISVDTMIAATEWCHENNIRVKHYYMVGIPSQTIKNINSTVQFIKLTKPDEIYCSIFMPYPGSRAWSMREALGIHFLFDINNFHSWENAYYQSNANYREASSPIETNTMSSHEIVKAREMIWAAFRDCHQESIEGISISRRG